MITENIFRIIRICNEKWMKLEIFTTLFYIIQSYKKFLTNSILTVKNR